MKPIIGITIVAEPDPADLRTGGVLKLNYNYAQAIADAGGIPLLIPPQADVEAIANIIDGWLIPGGLDIDPAEYGQENHPANEIMPPARYNLEKSLYAAIPDDLPVLGICYGCQFLNVMEGGDLIQHLPDEVEGSETHKPGSVQDYKVEGATKLGEIVGPEASGASYHHQAVGQVAPSLRVTARAEDGVIEAIESVDRDFLVAVQWHPERTPDNPTSKKLFQAFVDSARNFKKSRQTSKAGV